MQAIQFACYNCGAVFSERYACCIVCLEQGCIVPVPQKERVYFERPNREGCKSLAELGGRGQKGRYIEGFEALGKLPLTWKMLVYGIPGSGKSTLALQLANAFDGVSFYASIEEGFGESFLNKLATWEITNQRIIFSDCKTLRELRLDLVGKEVELVIVDSLTLLGEVPDLQGYAQVWISHATKEGLYKGNSSLGHLVDVIVRCENGLARVEKNRFSTLGEIRIFEELERG